MIYTLLEIQFTYENGFKQAKPFWIVTSDEKRIAKEKQDEFSTIINLTRKQAYYPYNSDTVFTVVKTIDECPPGIELFELFD